MYRNACLLSLCLFSQALSYSQTESLNRRKIRDLNIKIQTFIAGRDSVFSEGRYSEFAHLIIETDSTGMVTKIRTMGIETDSLYKMFKKMPVEYFSDWRGPKKRIIIIPYFYLSENSNNASNYVDIILLEYYRKIPGYVIMAESANTIIVKWLMSVMPLKPRAEENRINKVVPIDH
jgi:hypothetical protein